MVRDRRPAASSSTSRSSRCSPTRRASSCPVPSPGPSVDSPTPPATWCPSAPSSWCSTSRMPPRRPPRSLPSRRRPQRHPRRDRTGSAPPAAGEHERRPLASPSLRRRAFEAGIDLRDVRGTGPAGRIEHADLDAVLARSGTSARSRAPATGHAGRRDPGARPPPRHRGADVTREVAHPAHHLRRGGRRHGGRAAPRGAQRTLRRVARTPHPAAVHRAGDRLLGRGAPRGQRSVRRRRRHRAAVRRGPRGHRDADTARSAGTSRSPRGGGRPLDARGGDQAALDRRGREQARTRRAGRFDDHGDIARRARWSRHHARHQPSRRSRSSG